MDTNATYYEGMTEFFPSEEDVRDYQETQVEAFNLHGYYIKKGCTLARFRSELHTYLGSYRKTHDGSSILSVERWSDRWKTEEDACNLTHSPYCQQCKDRNL